MLEMKKLGDVLTLILGLVYGTNDVLQIYQGQIKGSILISRNKRNFYAFQGIPYAKPPINDLRFKVSTLQCSFLKVVVI